MGTATFLTVGILCPFSVGEHSRIDGDCDTCLRQLSYIAFGRRAFQNWWGLRRINFHFFSWGDSRRAFQNWWGLRPRQKLYLQLIQVGEHSRIDGDCDDWTSVSLSACTSRRAFQNWWGLRQDVIFVFFDRPCRRAFQNWWGLRQPNHHVVSFVDW